MIGASAGGLPALKVIISGLPKDLPAAVLVVLHVSATSPALLADILQRVSPLPVGYARDSEPIRRGRVYIAPPDQHMLVSGDALRLSRGPKENHCRPALDPLFRSAARACASRVIGVILTGMLDDGTAGLWAVKERGGTAVVQDPSEAQFPSMPQSAIRYVKVDHVCRVAEMAQLITRLTMEPILPTEVGVMSRQLEIEDNIAKGNSALQHGILELGSPSLYTCPECHGALLALKGVEIPRFRCHTGHSYTLSSLLSEVTSFVEDNVWNAVRALNESVLLLRHMARHLRDHGHSGEAEAFEARATEEEKRAKVLATLVMARDSIAVDVDESA